MTESVVGVQPFEELVPCFEIGECLFGLVTLTTPFTLSLGFWVRAYQVGVVEPKSRRSRGNWEERGKKWGAGCVDLECEAFGS